jgi:probable phosphoglycerate mutase
MTTRFVLINSCSDLSELTNRFYGATDVQLTEKGIFECEILAGWLKSAYQGGGPGKIVTSPLYRARFTAEFISGYFKGAELSVDENLRDINGGDWEDMERSEILARFPEDFMNLHRAPSLLKMKKGESMEDVYGRARKFAEKYAGENSIILSVSHELVIKCVICRLIYNDMARLGEIKKLRPASVTEIAVGERTEMTRFDLVFGT